MRTFDLTPLFRSTVGFDRMMNLLESASRLEEADAGYPPYNIEKLGDDNYRITMAVAGFSQDELNIETHDGALWVTGEHKAEDADHVYLHRGIAGRAFKRSFQLADFVRVAGARLENGLLHIDLVREVPEEMKPRRIEINGSAASAGKPKLVEDASKAA